MRTMTTEQKNDVLDFPIQEQDLSKVSWEELIFQGKLYGAKVLNRVATGQIDELPENIKASLRIINQRCKEIGFSPLEGEF